MTFEIAGDRGAFRGHLRTEDGSISGHWIQPPTAANGVRFASPVKLTRFAPGHWRGEVVPLDDRMTFYLSLTHQEDGSIGGFLRNPEANFGRHFRIRQVLRDGNQLRFIEPDISHVRLRGTYHPDRDAFSIFIPDAGGTFDFVRVSDDSSSPFYPRAISSEAYVYDLPMPRNDGWEVGSLEEVGMAVSPITEMIQMIIDTPIDSVAAPYIHAVLIARNGKLVLEEYFHGYTADTPHDTRSASKTVTSTLIGLAIHAGEPLDVSSLVYPIMYDGNPPADLDPRKMRMSLEHLLTMTPGLACDDNDADSPGNEWRMQSQTAQPDWLLYTLELPMIHEPGQFVAYCSASPNLAGGVLHKATGSWLPDLYQRYLAQPMQMGTYHMNLMPTGEAYGGGGLYITGRDFLKMGQIFLDDGQWKGTRLLGDDWVRDAVYPAQHMFEQGYGYAWWIIEFPYEDRTVQAFYAGGNGGQYVIGFPELEMAVVFFGANYNQVVTHLIKKEHVPNYILRSVALGEAEILDAR
jgi:CubicO group peptidase (beta-lactamase class C family)